MVTAELSASSRARVRVCLEATAALCAVTAAAVLAGATDPGLVSSVSPHPTLHPTIGAWASILLTNSRVLALPILLTAFGFHRGRYSSRLGDAAITGVLGANTVLVGLALGRWHALLIPYLPQLPIEWLAAGTATGAWLHARRSSRPLPARELAGQTAIVLGLLMAAAALEVFATPHAGAPR